MKYNRRKIKNLLDKYSMYTHLRAFTQASDIILTTKQLNTLGIILWVTRKKETKMCIKDLGKYLKSNTHSSLSRLVNSLKTKGFLNTNKKGRVVFISLSDKGLSYLNKLYEYFNRMMVDEKYFKTSANEDMAYVLDSFNKKRKAA